MINKLLAGPFYILFFLTPLFFTPFNHELFEFNKMLLVYLLSTIIFIFWLFKMVVYKQVIFNRTILDIPLVLFLTGQILSTIFSIDQHTSIYGYYSRLNGGLLSTLSYLVLYWALVSNFDKIMALKFLKTAVFSGFLVSLYAIPEHFGVSPSCVILTGRFAADCWVQDVQSRVFATLGQPNWLAAYLSMLIFPTAALTIMSFSKNQTAGQKTLPFLPRLNSIYYVTVFSALYLAFTFTYSRGASLGLIIGFILFLGLYFRDKFVQLKKNQLKIIETKPLLIILLVILTINLLFGSALTGNFRLINQSAPPPRPTISSGGTQLDQGGTESGQIRLIVWKGAVEIFRHYPIFGSGVETFAYSYYNFRPLEHNNTSEWDFLYNKAHNEYLNYLSTTGFIGILSYLLLIFSFLIYSFRHLFKNPSKSNQNFFLATGLLSGYISYLIQNIFGFSVVVIALFFYLFPAFFQIFSPTNTITKKTNKKGFFSKLNKFFGRLSYPANFLGRKLIFKYKFINQLYRLALILTLMVLVFKIGSLWYADYFYNRGSTDLDSGENIQSAFTNLSKAAQLNPAEPLYKTELAFALSEIALLFKDEDPTSSAEFAKEAEKQTETALLKSPKNLSLRRSAVRTYYQMGEIDPQYINKAIDQLDESIKLAPTDPKLYYNKGLLLSQNGAIKEGLEQVKKAAQLRPNYTEAHFTSSLLYEQLKDNQNAILSMEEVLKYDPQNQDAKKKLDELKKANL